MSGRRMLAVDIGAESGRGILGSFDGQRLVIDEVHRFENIPVPLPDGLHWNALALWNELRRCAAAAMQRSAAEGGQLSSLGIDTWGVDFGLLDRQGALIGSPFHYRDARTDGMMEAAFQRVSRADIYAQTGIQFMQFNSLYQLFSMAMRSAPALQIAAAFLTMPDLLNYWLTGVKGCEFTIATTTQCYDPRRAAWARPLLQRLAIPDHIFPEVIPPGTVLGPLREAVAGELGGQAQVIAPACHDTGSAVAAVPAEEDEFLWISSGTWSIMGVNVREPVINERSLAAGLTNEGAVEGAFRLSKNITGLWPVQECRRAWRAEGRAYSYDELTRMAAEAEPLRSLVATEDDAFLKPGGMPNRVREICRRHGQPIPESEGQVVRCLLEGLAMQYRVVLEKLESLLGAPGSPRAFDTIHIVGGGTKNRLLSQLTADATGRRVVTGPVEGTAVGNLLVQAAALGELSSLREAREVVCRSFPVETFEPDPARRAAWDEAYAAMLAL